jgi:hypothetical protein
MAGGSVYVSQPATPVIRRSLHVAYVVGYMVSEPARQCPVHLIDRSPPFIHLGRRRALLSPCLDIKKLTALAKRRLKLRGTLSAGGFAGRWWLYIATPTPELTRIGVYFSIGLHVCLNGVYSRAGPARPSRLWLALSSGDNIADECWTHKWLPNCSVSSIRCTLSSRAARHLRHFPNSFSIFD